VAGLKRLLKDAVRIGILALLTSVALQGSAHADYAERADVQQFVSEMARDHGFDEPSLLELFHQAQKKDRILESIARPAERTLEWHEYRNIFLKEPRISQGVTFWQENESALTAAARTYGVAPEYVVAILGVETRYGRHAGSYRVLDSLTTLAFDYPPRATFFRKQLAEYLLLAREEGRDPLWFMGSYAGAMGYGQFIPSSYRAYAVDFDGDGLRDIWTSETDAIGSVANYFREHGWVAGGTVALPVTLSDSAADALANQSLSLDRTVAELQALGVVVQGAGPEDKGALYRFALEDGVEYWLGLNNFYVITRYNRSRLYAMAVHQLSQELLERHQAGQEAR